MRVGLARMAPNYPAAPFGPGEAYPEFAGSPLEVGPEPNEVYGAVRQSLLMLGLDETHRGTSSWNPLKELVEEDRPVVIKPNFVNHFNALDDDDLHFQALVSQAAVMRPLVDYLALATRGAFHLVFADLPIQSARFGEICERSGLAALIDSASSAYPRATIELLDLRDSVLLCDRNGGVIERQALAGDPAGYVTVDLGRCSAFAGMESDAHLFRAPDYDGTDTAQAHSGGRHRYVLPRTILSSGLFINVPKLKVHRKVGATLSLKNLVGIIGDKSCLPHWRAGSPDRGGDEFPVSTAIGTLAGRSNFALRRMGPTVWSLVHPVGRLLTRFNRRLHARVPTAGIYNGDWFGNDTIWRMVQDLNRILFHADVRGELHDSRQRTYLSVVDGVIGGEGEGPLRPAPVRSGLVASGLDPLALDVVCARAMGLDWRKIPLFSRHDTNAPFGFSEFAGDPEAIDIRIEGRCVAFDELEPVHRFRPSAGWTGHIELEDPVSAPRVR